MTGRFTIGTAAALALVAASLACLAWDVFLVVRTPDEIAWKAAADAVRSGYRDGDCVVFDPPWAQEGAPLFEGLDLITTETVDWYEVGKRARVWVVSSPGGDDDAVPQVFAKVRDALDGSVRVSLYQAPTLGILAFDFLDGLHKAHVSRISRDATRQCTNFSDDRWYCGGVHRWQFVGRHTRDIAGAEREVIWAHPLENGIKTVIGFPGIPRGRTLVVRFGLTQRAIETGEGAPVTFVVDVDGKRAFERVLGVREEGWFKHSIGMSGGGSAVDVAFTVYTPDNKDRQFCFAAEMWAGNPE